MKDFDFSVCIWYAVFIAAVWESQLWENCKRERQDELLGLQKSCQKPFLSTLCPVDIHLASWYSSWQKLGAWKELFNFWDTPCNRTGFFFSFFWKDREGKRKKREKTWNSRNGKDFQTERHGKKSVGETGQGWIWHCAPLKRGTRHIQDVLILASRFVCSSRKSIWHITINMYWGILYILSQVCPALRAKINEADREKVPCEYMCVVCSAAAAHQLTAFLLSTVVPRWDLKRKSLIKFDHHLFHLRHQ